MTEVYVYLTTHSLAGPTHERAYKGTLQNYKVSNSKYTYILQQILATFYASKD